MAREPTKMLLDRIEKEEQILFGHADRSDLPINAPELLTAIAEVVRAKHNVSS